VIIQTQNKLLLSILILMIALIGLPSCQKKDAASAAFKKPVRIYKPMVKKQTAYETASRAYAPVLPLLDTIELPSSKQQLKEHIMLHNDRYNKKHTCNLFNAQYHNLPFVQYKWLLDRRIKQLKRYVGKLAKQAADQYNRLEQNIQNLIAQLEHLNEIIVTAEEYRQEKLTQTEHGGFGPFSIVKFGLGTIVRKLIFV